MWRKSVLIFICAFGLAGYSFAQPVLEDLPKVTSCIALKNVKLITSPGKEPQSTTVIMRDGLITHVGVKSKIPPDAFVIEADSLFAYPDISESGGDDPALINNDPYGKGWIIKMVPSNMSELENLLDASSYKELTAH